VDEIPSQAVDWIVLWSTTMKIIQYLKIAYKPMQIS